MKRKHILTSIAIFCIVFFSCKDSRVREYYLIQYTPPVVHDGYFGQKITEPKSKIKILHGYVDDSTAIANETKKFVEYKWGMAEDYAKKVAKLPKPKDDVDVLKKQALHEAYKEILSEVRFLLIIEHDKSFDYKEFVKLFQKYGLASKEVKKYMDEKNVVTEMHELPNQIDEMDD